MTQERSQPGHSFPAYLPQELKWPARIFMLLLVLLSLILMIHPLGDPDVYIHLRDGRYWVESGLQVDQEPFAYTVPDQPFEKVEWLFRIGLYTLWRWGGPNSLILVKAGLMTLAWCLLAWVMMRRWNHLGWVGLLMLLLLLASMTRFMVRERPYVFTYLLLPVVLLLLDAYRHAPLRDEPQIRKRLYWIPLLVIPWANLHPGFVVIFVFLGAHIAEAAWNAWRQDPSARIKGTVLLAIAAAAFAAGAINPLGFGLYQFIADMMSSSEFMRYILEWAPPKLSESPVFFVLLGASWVLLLFNLRRTRISDVLPLGVFSYMAVTSHRNMILFLFSALPLLMTQLQDITAAQKQKFRLTLTQRRWGFVGGSALVGGIIAFTLLQGQAPRLGEISRFYPEEGLAWFEKHRVQGRLLTHDIWGGYTGWITHGKVKIFMDGRLPTFGEALYAEYRKMIWGDPAQCIPLLTRYQIQALLVSPKNEFRLFQVLWQSQNWALVYWDDVSMLYLRRDGPNQSLIDRFEYRAMDPKRIPYFDPQKPDLAFQEIQRAAAEAPRSFLPLFFIGEFYIRQDNPKRARDIFMQVLKMAPQHVGTHFHLGHMDLQARDFPAAERHFRQVLSQQPQGPVAARACYYLALTVGQDPSRQAEAGQWARRAAELFPEWEPAQQLWQRLRSQP